MSSEKIGPIRLSGFIIGPILGSGILILPPLGVEVMGEWAIFGWVVMVCLSFMFAFMFGFLSMQFPGDAGVANAVEHAFGTGFKQLTAFYLTGAALFGPVAVLLTVVKYVNLSTGVPDAVLAYGILGIALWLLLKKTAHIGTVSFIMSSLAAVVLFSGAVISLATAREPIPPLPPFEPAKFGYGLLLLFWTIVGWEIIGNYTADIRDPRKTLPKAVLFSVLVIAAVSLAVAGGIQWVDHDGPLSATVLLLPLFGRMAPAVVALLAFTLCTTTYLAVTGAVARLLNALSVARTLPAWLQGRNRSLAPSHALCLLASIHGVVFFCVFMGWLDLEKLVSIADGFFLANTLMGILAAMKMFTSTALKIMAGLLAAAFCGILCFSAPWTLLVIAAMALAVPGLYKRRARRAEQQE